VNGRCACASKDLEAHIQGILKTFGIRISDIGQGRLRARFREELAAAGEADPSLAMNVDGFCAVHETLCVATDGLTDDLKRIAKESSLTQRLMTVPGVGPIVALNFVALIDDASRFKKTSDVGAFLGLAPRRYQSGETDRSGRVSKCGDPAMRGLLFEAASCLISQVKRFSPLKSWAIRLAGRKGFKNAAVATARKIAVLLLTIWKDGTEFQWTKEATTRSFETRPKAGATLEHFPIIRVHILRQQSSFRILWA